VVPLKALNIHARFRLYFPLVSNNGMKELTCADLWPILKSGAALGFCKGEMLCLILF